MTPKITLIYDADCPNAPEARTVLRKALERVGLEPEWVEHDRAAPGVPAKLARFGSPTILVDGADVAGETADAAAASCRVYIDAGRGLGGVPAVETIVSAILHSRAMAPGMNEVLSDV
jgi:hypothetical protein